MEHSEISLHEVTVYRIFREHEGRWLTNKEITGLAGSVAVRTVSRHTQRLVELGLIDQMETFPAYRYRWTTKASRGNQSYLSRLKKAADVFELADNRSNIHQ